MFFFKQKTAYEMRISDWSSDVCSSDLLGSFTLCLVSNAAGLFRLLGCRKVSRSAFCLKRRLTGFVSFLALAFGICSLFRFQMLQPRHKRLLGNREDRKSTRLNSSH